MFLFRTWMFTSDAAYHVATNIYFQIVGFGLTEIEIRVKIKTN